MAEEFDMIIIGDGTFIALNGTVSSGPRDIWITPDGRLLSEVVQRVRDGSLRTGIGNVAILPDAVAEFNPTEPVKGK